MERLGEKGGNTKEVEFCFRCGVPVDILLASAALYPDKKTKFRTEKRLPLS